MEGTYRLLYIIPPLLVLAEAKHDRIDQGNLSFKISGRNLGNGIAGKSDPFCVVFLSNDEGNTKNKIGETGVVFNDFNPDWANIFEVHFDRQKPQYLYFKIMDADSITRDDNLGAVWMNLAEYVDKGQYDNPKLSAKGHLEVKRADGVVLVPGRLPLTADIPHTLFFIIEAKNLPSKEAKLLPAKGDPYVTVSYTNNPEGAIHEIGRTSAIYGTNNPVFGETLKFDFDKNLDQRLRFRVYDSDKFIRDDYIEEAWLNVNDYVATGQHYKLLLPKGGTITIKKAVK
ncbi:unnamed protein product [Orchesella dallaii]|uniref:C2 domain-containing protein n=1 Tax=Orchesella dallaii TaxID=48710 RepID=A0ABP1R6L2_9HEXA